MGGGAVFQILMNVFEKNSFLHMLCNKITEEYILRPEAYDLMMWEIISFHLPFIEQESEILIEKCLNLTYIQSEVV